VVVVVMVVVVVVIVVVSMHITVPRVGRSQPVSPQYMQMYSSILAHTRPLVRLRWCAEYLHPQTTVLQLASLCWLANVMQLAKPEHRRLQLPSRHTRPQGHTCTAGHTRSTLDHRWPMLVKSNKKLSQG